MKKTALKFKLSKPAPKSWNEKTAPNFKSSKTHLKKILEFSKCARTSTSYTTESLETYTLWAMLDPSQDHSSLLFLY